MAKSSFQEELEQKAGRAILTRSVYRWESAVIIALTVSLALLTLSGVIPALFGVFQWWFWLVLGALGEIGLVWSSIKDPEFRARAVSDMFREKFKPREIKNKALRQRVEKALDYRERIDEVIAKSREGVMRDHMKDVSQGITRWMENVFRLARRLDAYMADDVLRKDLQTVKEHHHRHGHGLLADYDPRLSGCGFGPGPAPGTGYCRPGPGLAGCGRDHGRGVPGQRRSAGAGPERSQHGHSRHWPAGHQETNGKLTFVCTCRTEMGWSV
jgi:hypothetical protein